jgi:GNAT superfamily N-acetyltransferase
VASFAGRGARPIPAGALVIRPANEVGWDDLQTLLGSTAPRNCQCQRYKLLPGECVVSMPVGVRAERFREQTRPGCAETTATTGLVAHLDDEPVGWCAIEPRSDYVGMVRGGRVAWKGRSEDRDDPGVWAVSCFFTRPGFRRRGISRALAVAAVDHARDHGARAVEGYPLSRPGGVADELHVGFEGTFEAAGFREVSRPSVRRVVMRIDL